MTGPRTTPTVVPTMLYEDAPAAIDWLCAAFGFESHLVVAGEPGTIAHAQLTYGNGMIMLGSASNEYGSLIKPPALLGGVGSHSVFVIVPDADEHHDRALAAGAKTISQPRDQDYGGRGYGCTDPEGHLWYFGTYDPWAAT
ncbi:MAG: VOC family protein [Gemmatimonadota bacterium]